MASIPSSSDEQLIDLARKGDSKAYEALMRRYHLKIEQIIHFNLNDKAYIDDIAQEVLIKVYRYLPLFKNDCKFSTWLYRITQNTIKNHFRTSQLTLDVDSEDLHHLCDMSQSPEFLLINMEMKSKIDEAVAKLSNELRDCYGMHAFDGQTYEQIAKEIGCPIGTVRSRIFRARKILISEINKKNK